MISWEILGIAALVFVLRVANNGIGTLRVVIITQQKPLLAAVMGFFEALAFAITVAVVVADMSNILILFSYCFGFAVGSWVGMKVEAMFITSYMIVNIVSGAKGREIATALRDAGFGVTETVGTGRSGDVTMLRSVTVRKDVPKMLDIVHDIHAEAFISVEEARVVQRGWVRPPRLTQ